MGVAEVAELVDAPDSKSGALGRVGSIPTFGISISRRRRRRSSELWAALEKRLADPTPNSHTPSRDPAEAPCTVGRVWLRAIRRV
jgi:hypothetical protein